MTSQNISRPSLQIQNIKSRHSKFIKWSSSKNHWPEQWNFNRHATKNHCPEHQNFKQPPPKNHCPEHHFFEQPLWQKQKNTVQNITFLNSHHQNQKTTVPDIEILTATHSHAFYPIWKKCQNVRKWDKNIWVAGGNHKETLYYVFLTLVRKKWESEKKKWESEKQDQRLKKPRESKKQK